VSQFDSWNSLLEADTRHGCIKFLLLAPLQLGKIANSTKKSTKVQNINWAKCLLQAHSNFGLHTIKLKDLLLFREKMDFHRDIVTTFPAITIGSITLVDQIVLLCLDELLKPNMMLEIGTFQGYTTRLLVKNSSAKTIYSVDLPAVDKSILVAPDAEKVLHDGDYNDDYLRDIQNKSGEIYLQGLGSKEMQRIKLIKQDSTTIDFSLTFQGVNFVFIDGGHHYDIVRSDTEKSLTIIDQGIIIWHDFSSGIHTDVTRYLYERAASNQIFHVSGSLCAFQLIGF
jgi:hypothetical protein